MICADAAVGDVTPTYPNRHVFDAVVGRPYVADARGMFNACPLTHPQTADTPPADPRHRTSAPNPPLPDTARMG